MGRYAIQVKYNGEWGGIVDCVNLNPLSAMSLEESVSLMRLYQNHSSWQHRLLWVDDEKLLHEHHPCNFEENAI